MLERHVEAEAQVTEWDHGFSVVETARGRVDNRTWSELEADRLAACGLPAYIRENGGRRIAVMRGDPREAIGVVYVPRLFGKEGWQ